jgi:hypothetical protein
MHLKFATVFAAACLVTSSHAATQNYTAQGSLDTVTSYAYMEVFGYGTANPYANPATDAGDVFNYLIAPSSALAVSALGGYANGSSSFGYDPAAAPFFVSASGRIARYDIPPMTVQLSDSGGATIVLSATDTQLGVNRSVSANSQVLSFTRKAGTVDGPIPGSTFSYAAPSSSTSTVDLVTLMGPTAYFVQAFDLSAFSTLPVRLTSPTVYTPVGFVLSLGRFVSGGGFTTTPPASLNLADFNSAATLSVYFDGVFGVSVDAADYSDAASFAAASNWVSANIRQIDFEQSVDYALSSLTLAPVPEPGTWVLLLAGVGIVGAAARRRVQG